MASKATMQKRSKTLKLQLIYNLEWWTDDLYIEVHFPIMVDLVFYPNLWFFNNIELNYTELTCLCCLSWNRSPAKYLRWWGKNVVTSSLKKYPTNRSLHKSWKIYLQNHCYQLDTFMWFVLHNQGTRLFLTAVSFNLIK